MLREMAALSHNKHCFDCNQRGPTYVNMTIGAFICTACSGTVRGLNPPHRVKSISMASFTTEEMEFLKSRGNDFCRKVYLGLYDAHKSMEPNTKDEQKLRDFMTHKYEKKRWYVAPTEAFHEEARRMNSIEKSGELKPRNVLGGIQSSISQSRVLPSISAPPPASISINSHHIKKPSNLITDLQDPFQESQLETSSSKPVMQQEQESVTPSNGSSLFEANFANFDAFNDKSTTQTSNLANIQPFSESKNIHNVLNLTKPNMTSSDKYAALAALDSEFSSTSSVTWDGNGGTNFSGTNSSTFGNFSTIPSQNSGPFPVSNSAPGGFGANNGSTFPPQTNNQTVSTFNTTNATNPFNSSQIPSVPSIPSANPFMSNIQSQQNFNVNFQWNTPYQAQQPQQFGNSANPFMQNFNNSSNPRPTNSTNPFM
ncbi:DgyrCDS2292 [Dimorphilus gyrociliatus]|uniref:DgyrCDS2292 n=1 Tax=Dimorphilus gyrociliatus TaxID=2664684 RepID=A0A7I8VA34_9ANNE|nr:DgyrCDS2292 [Dimorphilus gyrociliatus]